MLVVGGGVTGAGVALDAATRGLRCVLVEQRDFASGTSSRSSKLFHGGLRYLEQMNFVLVREALRERELMLTRLAPHLVKPVLVPLPAQAPLLGAALRHRRPDALRLDGRRPLGAAPPAASRRKALKMAPALRKDALTGALLYYDAQADDARHTMMVARTAASYGATVLTSAKVRGCVHAGERVVGATVEDVETGESATSRPVVINSTGVWTDDIQKLAGGRGRFNVRASKGVHIVVPRDRINSETGMILRTEKSVLFVIPWGTHWIIGTTDTDWDLDRAHPAASRADIDYILDHVNAVLATPLTHDDIEGVYAGLRPLLAGRERGHLAALPRARGRAAAAGPDLDRRREVHDLPRDGRRRRRRRPGRPRRRRARQRHRADPAGGRRGLPGADQPGRAARARARPARLADHRTCSTATARWSRRCSRSADDDPALLQPLPGAEEYLKVEIVYARHHEGALHLDDLLVAPHPDLDRGPRPRRGVRRRRRRRWWRRSLGWDERRVDDEVAAYRARVAAERESQAEGDDLAANADRLAAPDIRARAVGRALD